MSKIDIFINTEDYKNPKVEITEKKLLTEKEMIHIIDNRLLHKCTKDERKQIMDSAFGKEFQERRNPKKN